MISIQTNVNSLMSQNSLRVNSNFQGTTIQQLSSGYRINSSADDAAGLAVANQFRSNVAQLTQGVLNANNGISTLQIADGGMSNISTMLDRLQTLATESASQTFTGNRNTVNNEFQKVLGEIDRQAQSVGLNSGGQFAKSLAVFIGGGNSATGGLDTDNGTVTMDLSNSAVDTSALGLKGTQITATQGTDYMAAIANATNTGNLTAQGHTNVTDFSFSGAGFSDSGKIQVAVDLTGVTSLDTLVTAINTAIQGAGTGTNANIKAFADAGITASAKTNANGTQSLAFTSANSAFQVEAGDAMANAFLGNLNGDSSTGVVPTQSVAGAATGNSGNVNWANTVLQINGGGLSSAVNISLTSLGNASTAAALTYIENQIGGNPALQAAGITVNAPAAGDGALTFTSSKGEKLNISVTGDTTGQLGYGTFVGSAAAPDYIALTGSTYTINAGSKYGVADLEFSINGGASSANQVSVDLSLGDATAAKATSTGVDNTGATTLTVTVDGGLLGTLNLVDGQTALEVADQINNNANVNTAVSASVNSDGNLVVTSLAAGGHALTLGGTNTLGIGGTTYGTARSGQSVADTLNSQFAANSTLAAAGMQATFTGSKLTISSSNNTYFRANAGGTAAHADIGFGEGATAGTAAYAGPASSSAVTAHMADAQGTTQTESLTFTALAYGGDSQAVTVSAKDASGALQSTLITLKNVGGADGTRVGSNIDSAIAYINQQLQASNNSTLQQIVALKETVTEGGVVTQKINFLSSLTGFSVSIGATANNDGFTSAAGTMVDAKSNGTGGSLAVDSQAGAAHAVSAIASAITLLGTAQGAVGQSQNQLNYAINLAQSQIDNFSAAESRIRDADVAADASNLSKAQVLQQATIAAMAQANSAPQAVLTLLRG